MPVWVDMFAREHQKSAWLTFLILASPLGIVLGYSMTSVITKHTTWQWSFWAQSLGMSPCVLAIVLIPKKYIDVESASNHKSRSFVAVERKIQKVIDQSDLTKSTVKKIESQESEEARQGMDFGFQHEIRIGDQTDGQPDISLTSPMNTSKTRRSIEEKAARKEQELHDFKDFLAASMGRYQLMKQ